MSRQDFFLNDDTGVILAEREGDIVGFYIYRRVNVGAERVLYGAATAILPEHQSQGIRKRLFPRFIPYEQEAIGDRPLYLAFRTRNPIIWHLVVKYHLKSVAPNLMGQESDPDLVELGRRVAKILYPDLKLEIPSMVMRGTHTTAYKEDPQHANPALNAAFYDVLTNKTDAIFSIGEVRRS